MDSINKTSFKMRLKSYMRHPLSFAVFILVMLSAIITMVILLTLIIYVLIKGVPHLSLELFEWHYTSENVSMMPAIINTILITFLSLIIAVPISVFSAIYLTEYAKKGNKIVKLNRMTTETLSGIPSIVYGLFGFLLFSVTCGLGYSILGGTLTLSIMILPLIMRTTEEALLSVPTSYREGSFGLGAGKLRTVFKIVLPSAVPGILSGVILATGRIVGETAALIYTSGTVAGLPNDLLSSGRTLAVHMYALLSEGLYTDEAYATAVVLLVMVAIINALSGAVARLISKR